jgi:hypothetical protein
MTVSEDAFGANGSANSVFTSPGEMDIDPSAISIIRKATFCPVTE